MSRISTFLFLLTFFPEAATQEIYKSASVEVGFYSSAPIEDIAARTTEGVSLWNTRTGEITFRVSIRGFQFEKKKMQEHFNENFMESHKYPYATFKGKLEGKNDLSQAGAHKVSLRGILEIHGVKQEREIGAVVRVQGEALELQTEFLVPVAAHEIEIPKILWKNIAEEVSVHVVANYSKLKP